MKKKLKIKALRVITALVVTSLLLCTLLGCGGGKRDDGKISIICTTFPLYDWAKNIIGDVDTVSLELLVENGTDLHSFQPSVADVAKISSADLLIHIGGSSDTWVQDAVNQAKTTELLTLSEVDGITLYMVGGGEHEHVQGEEHSHGHSDFDEHIWLSLKNAAVCSEAIANKLSQLDNANSEKYLANLKSYKDKLNALDAEYQAAADTSEGKKFLFADRFPFIYTTNDYDIEYFAAFSGCSTDVSVSFETIITLAEELDKNSLSYVLVTESSDKKIAEQIIEESQSKSASILVMDSMQSATASQIADGYSYFDVMTSNLQVLRTALSK